MDNTQLAQTVTWLDEQHRRDRAEITRLQQQVEAQTNEIQEQARRVQELETRITSAQTQLGRFNQIEQALQNLKNEVTLMLNAQAEEVSKVQRELERSRMTDREAVTRGMAEIRKELPRIRVVEEELSVRKVEDQRLSEIIIGLRQDVAAINKDIDERTRSLPYLIEQRTHDNKRIAQLQQENVELFKRAEEMSGKQQMLDQKQQKSEIQVQAAQVILDNIKKEQEQFIDSLKLADSDRQRQMREWGETFDVQKAMMAEQRTHIQTFAATHEETHRALAALAQFQERFQREQAQIAELQRLSEERQRKDMETFLADNEKRWKKQLLEWNFRWDQQDKFNIQVRERFPQLADQLDFHESLLQFYWREIEAQGNAQLKSAQQWLNDLQKFAAQRERMLKDYEEAKLGQIQEE